MKLYLDTSDKVCKVWVDDRSYSWESDRELANGLLKFLRLCLEQAGGDFKSVTGIGFMEGPGSYTGLRIGAAVVNTIASSEGVPIVVANGEEWRTMAKKRLEFGENDEVALPFYGGVVNITT